MVPLRDDFFDHFGAEGIKCIMRVIIYYPMAPCTRTILRPRGCDCLDPAGSSSESLLARARQDNIVTPDLLVQFRGDDSPGVDIVTDGELLVI